MVQAEITVTNQTGFHARPAALLVARAIKSKSRVAILYNGKTINAKSLLNVLGGGIPSGARIVVTAEGEDERDTLAALQRLIENMPD